MIYYKTLFSRVSRNTVIYRDNHYYCTKHYVLRQSYDTKQYFFLVWFVEVFYILQNYAALWYALLLLRALGSTKICWTMLYISMFYNPILWSNLLHSIVVYCITQYLLPWDLILFQIAPNLTTMFSTVYKLTIQCYILLWCDVLNDSIYHDAVLYFVELKYTMLYYALL